MTRKSFLRWAFAVAAVGRRLAAAIVPRPAPELAIKLPGGKQALLSQFRGKVVALAIISPT